ncbi:MAG: HlyC/CorC family transporter [Syntrophomonadaceae bacterium]|nr:HlyC/CorC family transporter [Syntrophomonadaceae bacterium]
MTTAIVFLVILIILNAFFAASEIAMISLNDARIKSLADKGDRKAARIEKLMDEPSRFLATIQIGITLAGFLASAFASETFADPLVRVLQEAGIGWSAGVLKTISMVVITILLSYFTLVFGELVPKRVAMKKSQPIAYFAIGPLQFLSAITKPLVSLLSVSTNFMVRLFGMDPHEEDDEVTEEEIRLMVDIGEEKGTIHELERRMINNIFEFDNKTVGNIMTHRTDIVALPVEAGLEQVLHVVNTEKFSRIPVYEDNLDNIVGMFYPKDLFQFLSDESNRDNFSLRQIIRTPYFVATSKPTDQLFREMQRRKTHIAVIIDEYGGTAGLVTIEDLLEEIVGNIFDEYDEEEKEFEKIDDNTYLISGVADLDDVQGLLGVEIPVDDYETLSGFVIGQLGRIPGRKDKPSIEYEGLIMKVEEVEEKRVFKVKVSKT